MNDRIIIAICEVRVNVLVLFHCLELNLKTVWVSTKNIQKIHLQCKDKLSCIWARVPSMSVVFRVSVKQFVSMVQ